MPQVSSAVRRTVLLSVLGAALAAAPGAPAATLAVDGTTLTYTAAAGKFNRVAFTQAGATNPDTVSVYRIDPPQTFPATSPDNDPIVVGAACTTVAAAPPEPEHYDCTGVAAVIARLGDLGDAATAASFAPSFPAAQQTGLVAIPITIDGGDGSDSPLTGGGRADTLTGGTGDDTMDGGGGDDAVDGGTGNDAIDDSGQQDLVTTPPAFTSNDTLNGGDGSDLISGGPGNDTVNGGDGDDGASTLLICGILGGVPCSSGLRGGEGSDIVDGGRGDDVLFADAPTGSAAPTADTYAGGAGRDTISYAAYSAGVNVTLDGTANDGQAGETDTVSGAENLIGGSGGDVLTGDATSNALTGGPGADALSGAGSNDNLAGGDGDDALSGGDGDDALSGESGDDTLNGDAGDDTLTGVTGDDSLNGGAGNDTADYAPLSGFVDITSSLSVSLDLLANDGAAGERDNANADGQVENIATGVGNDTLVGSAAANRLDAGYGSDTINAVDGTYVPDSVSCGPGQDKAALDAVDVLRTPGGEGCETVIRAPVTRVASSTTLTVSPKRDRGAPFRFTARGKVAVGVVPDRYGCRGRGVGDHQGRPHPRVGQASRAGGQVQLRVLGDDPAAGALRRQEAPGGGCPLPGQPLRGWLTGAARQAAGGLTSRGPAGPARAGAA